MISLAKFVRLWCCVSIYVRAYVCVVDADVDVDVMMKILHSQLCLSTRKASSKPHGYFIAYFTAHTRTHAVCKVHAK